MQFTYNIFNNSSAIDLRRLTALDRYALIYGPEDLVCGQITLLGAAVKLRKAVREEIFELDKQPSAVLASMGAASRGKIACDPESVLREADRAIYLAKKSGDRRIQAALRTGDK